MPHPAILSTTREREREKKKKIISDRFYKLFDLSMVDWSIFSGGAESQISCPHAYF